MDSRDIFSDTNTLFFLLDSDSLGSSIDAGSPLERLLRYKHNENIELLRSPGDTNDQLLESIEEYHLSQIPSEDAIEVSWSGGNSIDSRSLARLNRIATEIDYNPPVPTIDDIKRIDVFDSFHPINGLTRVYITQNTAVLTNRLKIESEFREFDSSRLHILTPRETAEMTGVFLRKDQNFPFYPSHDRPGKFSIDLPAWCWIVSRLLMRHTCEGEYLGSIYNRICSLIVGLDEIGEQFYRGTGNHTDIKIRYHFNNCISLLTGIGDALARHVRDEVLDLEIRDHETNIRIGNTLVNELQDEYKTVFSHIYDNHQFIEILHILRNEIIHSTGVIQAGPGFELREGTKTTGWKSHTISLGKLTEKDRSSFSEYYHQLTDEIQEYDPISTWGIVVPDSESITIDEHTSIDLYQFIKTAICEMVDFVDELLRLLGYQNFLEDLGSTGLFRKSNVETIAQQGMSPLLFDIDDPI